MSEKIRNPVYAVRDGVSVRVGGEVWRDGVCIGHLDDPGHDGTQGIDGISEHREKQLIVWDSWRKYIADGGKGSWPRDAFELVLDDLDEVKTCSSLLANALALVLINCNLPDEIKEEVDKAIYFYNSCNLINFKD